MGRRSTPEEIALRKARFLRLLQDGSGVRDACAEMGMHPTTPFRWRQEDAAFASACEEAREMGTEHLEDVAYSRAVNGSDTLLQFLLRARRPEVYGNKSEVNINASIADHRTLTMEQMLSRIQELRIQQQMLLDAPVIDGTADDHEPER